MSKYVLMVGSIFDGVSLVGPFENYDEAQAYLDQEKFETYEVTELEEPKWDEPEEDE